MGHVMRGAGDDLTGATRGLDGDIECWVHGFVKNFSGGVREPGLCCFGFVPPDSF
jgi:hypothetical protein